MSKNKATPDFCNKCRHLEGEGFCIQYKKCAAWRKWFRARWEEIQAAAVFVKEQELLKEQEKGEKEEAEIDGLEVSLQAMRNAANGYKSAYERESGSRITVAQDFADKLTERANENFMNFKGLCVHLHEIEDVLTEMLRGTNQ